MVKRVLWIGNSYIGRNDLPGMVATLCGAKGLELEQEQVTPGGCSLIAHHRRAGGELIDEARWDVVVLQEQSTKPVKSPAKFEEAADLMVERVKAVGATPVLYLTWARRDRPETQQQLTDGYRAVAQRHGAKVAAVGEAWRAVREAMGDDADALLFEADGSHPTPAGSYLAALVFAGVLTGRSPRGLPDPVGLEAGVRKVLQGAAAGVG
jgi:hypothetical protein